MKRKVNFNLFLSFKMGKLPEVDTFTSSSLLMKFGLDDKFYTVLQVNVSCYEFKNIYDDAWNLC